MSALDDLLDANRSYAEVFPAGHAGQPRKHLAIVVCMDARIDVYRAFGLDVGDAHVLRNAGGIPTDDVLRSLTISQRALGTREIAIVHHTKCGMGGFDDAAFRAELAELTGYTPGWDVPGFTDLEADVRRSVATVQNCVWLPHRDAVRGFVFDIESALLRPVD